MFTMGIFLVLPLETGVKGCLEYRTCILWYMSLMERSIPEYTSMAITGDHIRMIRGALRLTGREFATITGFDKMTIVRLERGGKAYDSTWQRIREAFAPYVEFIEVEEGVHAGGIILKLGATVPESIRNDANDTTDKPDSGLHSRAWDDEFDDAATSEAELSEDDRQLLEYARTAPHLSDRGREVLMRTALKR
jgi:hypothetical protein